MTNYQYIADLFTAVLANSKAIEGRFYVGYRYGLQEINYDNVGQTIDSIKSAKKYPLVLMAPPTSQMVFSGKKAGWERFRIVLFFMKTSYYDSDNHTINPDPNTGLSTHSVMQDWHDMKRCVLNFTKQLVEIQRNTFPAVFAVPDNQTLIIPVSHIGIDHVSGVRFDFDFDLWTYCELEDYDELLTCVNIPLDSHGEHKL